MNIFNKKNSVFTTVIWVLSGVIVEFYNIAWGTGNWLGEFSLKWGFVFVFFLIFLIALLGLLWLALWQGEVLRRVAEHVISIRQELGFFRWVFALIVLILPLYFLQYTLWGLIFTSIYFRIFIGAFLIIFLAILFTPREKGLVSWHPFLLSILLSGASFTIASVFSNVKAYPFNLYWSDGNRIWDYSIMFGRRLYNYPADQPIDAFISSGRQFVWGLPFLLPNTSILFNRFWSALVLSLPYAILGWTAFRVQKKRKKEWLLVGLWVFLFLNQGPIYTPLVLSAILVAIAWGRPLWMAMPLVAFAGYYAESARWTWVFAPAIWAGLLSMSGSKLKDARLTLRHWLRAIILAISGISIWLLSGSVPDAQTAISKQPLLWYRLLPNATYPEGVLGGLLIAILPLSILLLYLVRKKYWQPSLWQKIAILGSLLAFLGVGLVISTKIGGGNNLHNLDMFLIALVFVTAIAWKNGGGRWFAQSENSPLWIKITLILLILLPSFSFLRKIQPRLPLTPAEIMLVETLTDTDSLTSPPINSLPSDAYVQEVLDYISTSVEIADEKGEVLFIDLRQLLTFGYVPKIRLVPEYEKKRLMEASITSDVVYLSSYYEDLANHRFSMIITEPLKTALKNEKGVFSEEGDAWAVWVAAPTLCYYEPLETLRSVYIQLLVPRQEPVDCSTYLP